MFLNKLGRAHKKLTACCLQINRSALEEEKKGVPVSSGTFRRKLIESQPSTSAAAKKNRGVNF
jgi:hypothetical protein